MGPVLRLQHILELCLFPLGFVLPSPGASARRGVAAG